MILADALANGFKTAPAVASVVASVASGKNGVATTQATAGGAVAGVATVATQKSNTEMIGEISKKTMDLRLGISGHARFDDRHYCHQCQHMISGRCVVERFRPVDDIPRRCRNFEANSTNIVVTTKETHHENLIAHINHQIIDRRNRLSEIHCFRQNHDR